MAEESQNSKKTIKHLRRGLSIYKTGRSPFWHARIYDAVKKKYVVRSTKETNRIEAAEVAEEIVEAYKKKQNPSHAVSKDRSFEHYAKILSEITKQKARSSSNKYAFGDQSKILFRETDGLVSYFGKYDVGKITPGMVRYYLLFLDQRRDNPLAMSTKSKQCGVIRQVLMIALEDGVIDIIPPMPKIRTVDKPRISFTEAEYSLLLETARSIADGAETLVRGIPVTREHYNVIVFAVHSFLRPTETELFGIRFCDIEVMNEDPQHLLMTLTGKTGYRKSATLKAAVDIFEKQQAMHIGYKPTDYLFMPEYECKSRSNTGPRKRSAFLIVAE